MVSTIVGPEDRPRAFGLLTASPSTAAVLGPPPHCDSTLFWEEHHPDLYRAFARSAAADY